MDLRGKALLALEEATQECRYGKVPRTYAVKFALAYLWTLSGKERRPFDELWKALDDDDQTWRYRRADHALSHICWAVGVDRDHDVLMRVWCICQERHKASRSGPPVPETPVRCPLPCQAESAAPPPRS